MPLPVTAPWQCEIEKYHNGEYWVNRYYLNSDSLLAAAQIGEQILNAERMVHRAPITFTKYSVRSTAKLDYIYQTVPVNQPGLAAAGTDLMPLFVVARCDFTVHGSRPSRKYLRGFLLEGDVTGMTINASVVEYVNTNYVNPIAALAGFVDPQNADVYGGSCSPVTGMRQLRRGSKKKRTP